MSKTIEDVKAAKEELENRMQEMLEDFEEENDVDITSIELEYADMPTGDIYGRIIKRVKTCITI